MSHPVDEAPAGIFDLAGSASEWLSSAPRDHKLVRWMSEEIDLKTQAERLGIG